MASTSEPSTNKGANSNTQKKTTKSSIETGHAKNTANFQTLISFCQGFGANYNPSKPSLQITQLQNALTSSQTNLSNVITTNTAYNNAVNERVHAFEGLKKLSTQLVNALAATDASKSKLNDAKMYNTKMQGKSVKPTKSDAGKTSVTVDPNTPAPESPKTISTSQQSYDNIVEHFAKLIDVLATEATYNPNEAHLKTATLNTQLTDLKNKNTAVINAYTTVSNARISRNKGLYEEKTGLCDIAADVKNYVKSVFGASSPQYKQISSLAFKKAKL